MRFCFSGIGFTIYRSKGIIRAVEDKKSLIRMI